MRELSKIHFTDEEILKMIEENNSTLDIAIKENLGKNGFAMYLASKTREENKKNTAKHFIRRFLRLKAELSMSEELIYKNPEFSLEIDISLLVENQKLKSDIGDRLQSLLGNF